MRSVNIGGNIMQLQPAGINNGFLQSIPVQNIPGLGNVQVISAVQPTTVQTLQQASTPTTVHIENDQPKWQIVQTIQSNGTTTIAASPQAQQTQAQQQQVQVQQAPQTPQQSQHNVSTASSEGAAEPSNKQHRRRVACTCPNCGDGDR